MKCDNLQRYEVRADYDAGTIDVPCDNDKYGKYFLVDDVMEAIAELKQTIDELVGAKKSAEQILKNLLDCGLIKEWYFNGKFNAVLKADDPHLQIAELKQKLEDVQASMYCDVVDAGMRERKLRRALWLARAYRAKEMCQRLLIQGFDPKWEEVERKCLKKAEECK